MVSADLLRNFALFEGFSDGELKRFADLAFEESFKAGAQLWKKGDPANKLLLLLDGKALMTMDIDAGTYRPPVHVVVDIITKGESLGWSAVVDPYLYTRAVRCLNDAKVITFDGEKLRGMLREDATLGYKFIYSIAKVIRDRLYHTEIILAGERGLAALEEA
jgi:CRP-like cAMP-binding protein